MKVVTIGGGDPFLYPFLPAMIRSAKKAGLFVHVDTNALALRQTPEVAELIAESVDLIGLPLDGSNARIHGAMRSSPGHFDLILRKLAWLDFCVRKIKVNTIVTAANVADLPLLRDLVERLRPARWSVYQYWPLSLGAKAQVSHGIERQSFVSAVASLEALKHVRMEVNPLPSRRLTYPFVSHEGEVYLHSGSSLSDYEKLGTLFDDRVVDELFSRCGPEREEAKDRYRQENAH